LIGRAAGANFNAMHHHVNLSARQISASIHARKITIAGNRSLKIYGTLHCKSGKRMKRENRVFFVDEREAMTSGFRPCGHCLPDKYREWKLKMAI
jgi:methylphosphotriester-DNA--protein-cysteine methyltransferase